jgi:hypothetical protein
VMLSQYSRFREVPRLRGEAHKATDRAQTDTGERALSHSQRRPALITFGPLAKRTYVGSPRMKY